jgi:hypothetical protein
MNKPTDDEADSKKDTNFNLVTLFGGNAKNGQ